VAAAPTPTSAAPATLPTVDRREPKESAESPTTSKACAADFGSPSISIRRVREPDMMPASRETPAPGLCPVQRAGVLRGLCQIPVALAGGRNPEGTAG